MPLWSKAFINKLIDDFPSYITDCAATTWMPSLAGFARRNNVLKKEILFHTDGPRANEKIIRMLDQLKDIQEDLILGHSLNNVWNSRFSAFVAYNLFNWKNPASNSVVVEQNNTTNVSLKDLMKKASEIDASNNRIAGLITDERSVESSETLKV